MRLELHIALWAVAVASVVGVLTALNVEAPVSQSGAVGKSQPGSLEVASEPVDEGAGTASLLPNGQIPGRNLFPEWQEPAQQVAAPATPPSQPPRKEAEIQLLGIVQNGTERVALVMNLSDHSYHLLRGGQEVADFEIVSISEQSVVVKSILSGELRNLGLRGEGEMP